MYAEPPGSNFQHSSPNPSATHVSGLLYSTPDFVTSTVTVGSEDFTDNTSIDGSPSRLSEPPVDFPFGFGSALMLTNGLSVVLRGSTFGTVVVGAFVVAVVAGAAVDDEDVVAAALTVKVPVRYVIV